MYMSNPTGRNTDARKLTIGDTVLFFSYETLIGVIGAQGKYRSTNDYSKTTRRHMSEMGLTDKPRMEEDYLQRYAELNIMADLMAKHLPHKQEAA